MAIEIVDLPINSMVNFHSCVAVYQRVMSAAGCCVWLSVENHPNPCRAFRFMLNYKQCTIYEQLQSKAQKPTPCCNSLGTGNFRSTQLPSSQRLQNTATFEIMSTTAQVPSQSIHAAQGSWIMWYHVNCIELLSFENVTSLLSSSDSVGCFYNVISAIDVLSVSTQRSEKDGWVYQLSTTPARVVPFALKFGHCLL